MPSDRRDLISDVYHRALARAPEERAAFLVEACNGDEALREEVASLLEFEPASAWLLERSPVAVGVVAATDATSMIDRRLGAYTIVARLGVGGMGEVYRAHDSKLGRDVAIKILPAHFTAESERRARFAREARTLATLNHPHIGAIYGLEEADGLTALVLELVEGPTLADRLERGALPISQALAIARQIAEALEAAHDNGIVHRDLKPANIVLQGPLDRLSNELRAKVLDFGLAKPMAVDVAASTQVPSASFDGTAEGRILGTPAYMSPEQARGHEVDRRTDIWAFGCVLFEMLSGRRAFAGETVSDTFVSVLEREPDWDAVPRDTPAIIRTLVRRCLRKDPQKRLHDIADALLDIDDAVANPSGTSEPVASTARVRYGHPLLPWLAAGALAIALARVGWLYHLAPGTLPAELAQLTIHPPEGVGVSLFALSPDGRYLAFTPIYANRPMLWVTSLVTGETRALRGTERARAPFWKPDSQEIAYYVGDQLETMSLRGGSPITVTTTNPQTSAGAWGRSNVILTTTPGGGPLRKVSATGGTLEPATVLGKGEYMHAAPVFLPDGVHFLYMVLRAANQPSELRVGSLESKQIVESLGPVESNVAYSDGYLFFVRGGHEGGGSLTVQPFDPEGRRPVGDQLALGLPTAVYALFNKGAFSVSTETNRLVYLPATASLYDLAWYNRSGDKIGIFGDPGEYLHVDLSPDERHVAVSRQTQEPGKPPQIDIWTIELKAGGRSTRVTNDPAFKADPAWSGDGRQLAFNLNELQNRPGKWGLFAHPSDGSGQNIRLAEPAGLIASPDWSLDNKYIIYDDGGDLWTLPMDGHSKPSIFLKTPAFETDPVFSHDGRWVAYTSDKSGRDEVYIHAFVGNDTAHPVSRGGGWAPRWSGNGKELFFLNLDSTMMAATIDPATGVTIGVPRELFPTGLRRGYQKRPYDVTADGQRFLVPTMRPADDFRVVLNWRALLPK